MRPRSRPGAATPLCSPFLGSVSARIAPSPVRKRALLPLATSSRTKLREPSRHNFEWSKRAGMASWPRCRRRRCGFAESRRKLLAGRAVSMNEAAHAAGLDPEMARRAAFLVACGRHLGQDPSRGDRQGRRGGRGGVGDQCRLLGIRAHQHAAGARKKGAARPRSMRSRSRAKRSDAPAED